MKKIAVLSILVLSILIAGCSNKTLDDNEIEKQSAKNKFSGENSVNSNNQLEAREAYKLYFNTELGIAFEYPKNWPEPFFVENKISSGSYFDNNNQWEIGLGEPRKNGIEDIYLMNIRGYYDQEKDEITSQITDPSNENSLWLDHQFNDEKASYLVYDEAGISSVKNIMVFLKEGGTLRIQSRGNVYDSEIYSIASSLRSFSGEENTSLNNDDNSVDSENDSNTQQGIASENVVYENDDYNFKITMPKTWENYKIKETQRNNSVEMYFGLPLSINYDQKTNTIKAEECSTCFARIYPLVIYGKDEFERLEAEGAFALNRVVGENDRYVFIVPKYIHGHSYDGQYIHDRQTEAATFLNFFETYND